MISLLVASFLSALFWNRGQATDGGSNSTINDLCQAVRKTATDLNNAQRTFTFRCRQIDDCGGIGDRLGGIIGGTFYALMTDRSYRIRYTGLEYVFSPGFTNWTFDLEKLGIPPQHPNDANAIHPKFGDTLGEQYNGEIIPETEGSKMVGIVNDLNARQILNPDLLPKIEEYEHVYFHSNRGPNEKFYIRLQEKYNWPKIGNSVTEQYYNVVQCVFRGLFRPTTALLNSHYKSVGRHAIPFSKLIEMVEEDQQHVSVAVHYRVNDVVAETRDSTEHLIDDNLIQQIADVAHDATAANKKANLFFLTNSDQSSQIVMDNPILQQQFNEIYCQELQGTKHVNAIRKDENVTEAGILSSQQAWRDWWVMFLSDVLMFPNSGFSVSAAIFASQSQIKFFEYRNNITDHPWNQCGTRFC